jgi:hypothetical protein
VPFLSERHSPDMRVHSVPLGIDKRHRSGGPFELAVLWQVEAKNASEVEGETIDASWMGLLRLDWLSLALVHRETRRVEPQKRLREVR